MRWPMRRPPSMRLEMRRARRARQALDALRDAPWSLRELAVGGDALMPLLAARGVPARQMGRLLEALWRMAAEGRVKNEPAALLGAADEWLNRIE